MDSEKGDGQEHPGSAHEGDCKPQEDRRKFQFFVDSEQLNAYSTGDTAELTVGEVLDMSGNQPAESYFLVEFIGEGFKERVKHEDLNEVLKIKDHTRFAAGYRACTPVS